MHKCREDFGSHEKLTAFPPAEDWPSQSCSYSPHHCMIYVVALCVHYECQPCRCFAEHSFHALSKQLAAVAMGTCIVAVGAQVQTHLHADGDDAQDFHVPLDKHIILHESAATGCAVRDLLSWKTNLLQVRS